MSRREASSAIHLCAAFNGSNGIEDAIKSKREVDYAENGVHESNIYDFDKLEPGMKFNGPAIVEDPSTTIVILPKQECFLDEFSNLHINIEPSFEK